MRAIYLGAELTQVTDRQGNSPQTPPWFTGKVWWRQSLTLTCSPTRSLRRPFSGPDSGSQLSYLEEQLIFCDSLNGLDKEVAKRQPLIYLLFHLLEHEGATLEEKGAKGLGSWGLGGKVRRTGPHVCY